MTDNPIRLDPIGSPPTLWEIRERRKWWWKTLSQHDCHMDAQSEFFRLMRERGWNGRSDDPKNVAQR